MSSRARPLSLARVPAGYRQIRVIEFVHCAHLAIGTSCPHQHSIGGICPLDKGSQRRVQACSGCDVDEFQGRQILPRRRFG